MADDFLERRLNHLTDLAPHARDRKTPNLLREAADALAAHDLELSDLRAKLETALADADQWKYTANMYANAWQRELRFELIPKTHLIDSLVLSTRAIVEKAGRQAPCCGVPELCGDEWCNKLLRYRLATR